VNTSRAFELFNTVTHTTAAGAATSTIPFDNRQGFNDGDILYIGTNAARTISDGALPATGAGNITITGGAITFAAEDPIILKRKSGAGADDYAPIYDDPQFSNEIGVGNFPWTGDSNNEWAFYSKHGVRGARFSTAADVTLRTDAYMRYGDYLDWRVVTPNHNSPTSGIQEAIDLLDGAAGVVYIPEGTYNVWNSINVHTGLKLIGAGRTLTTLFHYNPLDATVPGTSAGGLVNSIIRGANDATSIEIAGFKIDGNSENLDTASDDLYYGIVMPGGNNDSHIHDMDIMAVYAGIFFSAAQGASYNSRCIIERNYIHDIGRWGIRALRMIDSSIMHNTVIQTGGTGISLMVLNADLKQAPVSFRNRVIGNYVNRATAPTTLYDAAAFTGIQEIENYLMDCRGNADYVIANNILWDNRKTSTATNNAGDDGFGSQGIDAHRGVITGNIVGYAGAFGIDVGKDCVCVGNHVYKPGTHGIVAAQDTAAIPGGVDYGSLVINANLITDPNEVDTTANIAAIHVHVGTSGSGSISALSVVGNIVHDTQARHEYGLNVDSGTAGDSIGPVTVDGNFFKEATLAGIFWDGTNYSEIRVGRGNIMPTSDPYQGVTYLTSNGLVGGTARGRTIVLNANWPDISTLRFGLQRGTINSSTAIGVLSANYDGTNKLTIKALRPATVAVETNDKSAIWWEFLGTYAEP
jgi:hypothetical protein